MKWDPLILGPSHPLHRWVATVYHLHPPAISLGPLPLAKCEGLCSKRHLIENQAQVRPPGAQNELVNWENLFISKI